MSDETKCSEGPLTYETFSSWPGGAEVYLPDGRMMCDLSEADARRMVALWNACAGISTDALESGALTAVVEEALAHCEIHMESGIEPVTLAGALRALGRLR